MNKSLLGLAIFATFLSCKARLKDTNKLKDFYDSKSLALYWSVGQPGSESEYFCRGECTQAPSPGDSYNKDDVRQNCQNNLRYLLAKDFGKGNTAAVREFLVESKKLFGWTGSPNSNLSEALTSEFLNQPSQDASFQGVLGIGEIVSAKVGMKGSQPTEEAKKICLASPIGSGLDISLLSGSKDNLPSTEAKANTGDQNTFESRVPQPYAKCQATYRLTLNPFRENIAAWPEYPEFVEGPVTYNLFTYALDIEDKNPLALAEARFEKALSLLKATVGLDLFSKREDFKPVWDPNENIYNLQNRDLVNHAKYVDEYIERTKTVNKGFVFNNFREVTKYYNASIFYRIIRDLVVSDKKCAMVEDGTRLEGYNEMYTQFLETRPRPLNAAHAELVTEANKIEFPQQLPVLWCYQMVAGKKFDIEGYFSSGSSTWFSKSSGSSFWSHGSIGTHWSDSNSLVLEMRSDPQIKFTNAGEMKADTCRKAKDKYLQGRAFADANILCQCSSSRIISENTAPKFLKWEY